MRGLYLLHLEPPYLHAKHYLGYSSSIRLRVLEHAAGGAKASPLIRAQLAAGGRFWLVRVWPRGDQTLERRLKRSGHVARFCPLCRPAELERRRQESARAAGAKRQAPVES